MPSTELSSVRINIPDGRACDLGDLTLLERPRAPQIAATRTPPAAKPGFAAKRAGAKAAKGTERERIEYKRSLEDAIIFAFYQPQPTT